MRLTVPDFQNMPQNFQKNNTEPILIPSTIVISPNPWINAFPGFAMLYMIDESLVMEDKTEPSVLLVMLGPKKVAEESPSYQKQDQQQISLNKESIRDCLVRVFLLSIWTPVRRPLTSPILRSASTTPSSSSSQPRLVDSLTSPPRGNENVHTSQDSPKQVVSFFKVGEIL